ncbi:hypothetical protein CC80DRAFT_37031 [Byssothecium circinans]|uniref:Zn(2)-C6 fungal-type domain-containing protein n=1 Tax=Byssothecium circinans TaxID=147558 RepID=A0A6A5TZ63_9PLEO|nr:hypothetical protein CC80DRAFT_37031 [Byssothecium circinans]
MVYRGKPSAACGECRKRRSRCDLALPACGQCIRTKRKCPGYRNAVDLLFFDQNEQAAKRSKPRGGASDPPTSKVSSVQRHMASAVTCYYSMNNVILYQSVNDVAVNYFMDSYVGSDQKIAEFGFVSAIYSRQGFNSTELQRSLTAFGLAAYSKASQRPDLLRPATKSYITAVRGVNTMLSGSNFGQSGEALLASVVLLAMFEIIITPTGAGLANFSRHLKGAVTIASMLIKQKKAVDSKLLRSVLYCLIVEAWMQNKEFTPEFFVVYGELNSQKHPNSLFAAYVEALLENMAFRNKVNCGELSTPTEIIVEAVRVDRRTKDLMNLPDIGRFDKVWLPGDIRNIFQDALVHRTQSNFRAYMWNNLRIGRIHMHRLIISQCAMLLSSASDSPQENAEPEPETLSEHMRAWIAMQEQKSKLAMQYFAREVCGTLPQMGEHTNALPSLPEQVYQQVDDSPNAKGPPKVMDLPAMIMLSAIPRSCSLFIVFFQLSNLSTLPYITEDLRQWIQCRRADILANSNKQDSSMLRAMLDRSKLQKPPGAAPKTSHMPLTTARRLE